QRVDRLRHRPGAHPDAARQSRRRGAVRRADGYDRAGGQRTAARAANPAPHAAPAGAETIVRDQPARFPSRRSLVFIVSDFFSTTPWTAALAQLAQRHEVIAVRLYDPLEHELPDLGLLTMQDAETGEQVFVDTHDRGFRR